MTNIEVLAGDTVYPDSLIFEILGTGGTSTYSGSGDGVLFSNGLSRIEIYRDSELAFVVTNHRLSQADFDYAALGNGREYEVVQRQAPFHVDGTNATGLVQYNLSDFAMSVATGPAGSNIRYEVFEDVIFYDGGAGTDTLDLSYNFTGVDLDLANGLIDNYTELRGTFEVIIGSDNDDTITGDMGDQTVHGGDGKDTLDGGSGIDTLTFSETTRGISVYLNLGEVTDAHGNLDVVENFEAVIGTSSRDFFTGDGGDNLLFGEGGNDWFDPYFGNNIIQGGEGYDTLEFYNRRAVEVYIRHGIARSEGEKDRFFDIESIIGSEYDDRMFGASGIDNLSGSWGNDFIKGHAGDDLLSGDDGRDTINGGDGDDQINGGDQSDRLLGAAGNDSIEGYIGNDRIRGGKDNDSLTGGQGYDNLRGDDGDDELFGGLGKDYLIGGTGRDLLSGDAGNDILVGGNWGVGGDGESDTFQYYSRDSGRGGGYDRVKDFEDGIDVIELLSFQFSDFSEIEALASQVNSGVKIKFQQGDVLLIEGLTLAEFDASDVLF